MREMEREEMDGRENRHPRRFRGISLSASDVAFANASSLPVGSTLGLCTSNIMCGVLSYMRVWPGARLHWMEVLCA